MRWNRTAPPARTDGGPAFPEVAGNSNGIYAVGGMSLRDWFAGSADSDAIDPYRTYGDDMGRTNTDVQARYAYADAMIAERGK